MERSILRVGSTGPDVQDLTRFLVGFGHLDKEFEGTAKFDQIVKAGVLSFQSRHLDPTGQPLVVDGVVGPVTWWALQTSTTMFPDSPVFEVPTGNGRGYGALLVGLQQMKIGAKEEIRNNDGQYVRRYLNGVIDPPANWCAAFVSWCFKESGSMPFNYTLGAREMREQFKRKGWTYNLGDRVPQPGDCIFFWRGMQEGWQGHVGFVVNSRDGILTTLEGNKGAFPAPVRTFSYVETRIEKLLGFGHIPS